MTRPEQPHYPYRSMIALVTQWEDALDTDDVTDDLVGALGIEPIRELVVAVASSDAAGNATRALSGAEACGALPRGAGALAGRMANPEDGAWFSDVFVGEGVEPGQRMRRLATATADREHLEPEAAAGAAVVHAWCRWQLGEVADARGVLAGVLDQDPGNEVADLLFQVIDVQRQQG